MNPLIAIIVTLLLVIRAYSRQSLTALGIITAALTATIHALYPSPLPFTLLCVFFLLGTTATKVKHDVKANLTLSSSGHRGGEGARTSTQVLANSGCASILILLHLYKYGIGSPQPCFQDRNNKDKTSDLLLLGIISNYAAVAADTLSSELGILAQSNPVLITTLRPVPRGTNGGVTIEGLAAGIAGSAAIALTSLIVFPLCNARDTQYSNLVSLFTIITTIGTLGTLLDSLLGALFQASVIDRRTGKIIEGTGGIKVLIAKRSRGGVGGAGNKASPNEKSGTTQPGESRIVNSGRDILDNNQINFLMASVMTVAGMVVAGSVWDIPFQGLG